LTPISCASENAFAQIIVAAQEKGIDDGAVVTQHDHVPDDARAHAFLPGSGQPPYPQFHALDGRHRDVARSWKHSCPPAAYR
jgi:hypothetical protein